MKQRKYTHDTITHNTKAAEVMVPYILSLIQPNSVLDVGCGLGTWAHVFKHHGKEIFGVDWEGVDRSLLMLNEDEFQAIDLEGGFDLGKKFDLVVCLEVAEHLKADSAELFVNSLVNHSDNLIFSAAIPNQGGDNHINEQPFDYWIDLFSKHGFHFYDCFRDRFWQDNNVEWWYRQNMFLVSRSELPQPKTTHPNLYIHPGLFQKKLNELERFYNGDHSILTGIKFLFKTIKSKFS